MDQVDVLDEGSGVRTRNHQADFLDVPMEDLFAADSAALFEVVRIDGQRGDILVLDSFLHVLSTRGIVEIPMRVDTEGAVFEDGVTKHVLGIVVLVHPDERNGHLVHVRERIGLDDPAVGASQVVLGRPATEVWLLVSHFDDLLSTV